MCISAYSHCLICSFTPRQLQVKLQTVKDCPAEHTQRSRVTIKTNRSQTTQGAARSQVKTWASSSDPGNRSSTPTTTRRESHTRQRGGATGPPVSSNALRQHGSSRTRLLLTRLLISTAPRRSRSLTDQFAPRPPASLDAASALPAVTPVRDQTAPRALLLLPPQASTARPPCRGTATAHRRLRRARNPQALLWPTPARPRPAPWCTRYSLYCSASPTRSDVSTGPMMAQSASRTSRPAGSDAARRGSSVRPAFQLTSAARLGDGVQVTRPGRE
jgi:hypothetical protein